MHVHYSGLFIYNICYLLVFIDIVFFVIVSKYVADISLTFACCKCKPEAGSQKTKLYSGMVLRLVR